MPNATASATLCVNINIKHKAHLCQQAAAAQRAAAPGIPGAEASSTGAGACVQGHGPSDLEVARGIVAREERKQLELVAARRAAPMEQEAGSVEGRSPGSQAAGAQLSVGPKRARTEPPEAG